MRERQAVTGAVATRYRLASEGAKKQILDELCATTGWHRDHACKALRHASTHGPAVMAVLPKVWAVMDAPAGKRMAPFLAEMVARLRAGDELAITDCRP